MPGAQDGASDGVRCRPSSGWGSPPWLHAGAPLEDVVVFGDGLNDISMFIPPFFRIAMGNARPQLKERADYITDDNDKGGILHACQKFGWLS